MRLVMGAQNCGFGPAAELVAVARALSGHERIFVGDGVAAEFAHCNPDAFDEIRSPAPRCAGLRRLLDGCDGVVSVMDADLVLHGVLAERPVILLDSLFSFWRRERPLAEILRLCETLPRTGFGAADRHLGELSPHERVLAAHLLATHGLVQNFPGVRQRIAEFAALGVGRVPRTTGALVDHNGLRAAAGGGTSAPSAPAYDLLVNLGGFRNFLLDFDEHNDYLLLIERWLPDLLRDWPRFRRVLVCGGPFGGRRARTVAVDGRLADCRLVPQRELLRHVATTPHYLLTPGLTALHEALALGRLPLALPEQHYAHLFTVRRLERTLFAKTAVGLAALVPGHPVPEDDVAGTAALVELAGRIRRDDTHYDRFRRCLNERIEQYLTLGAAERRAGVEELRAAMDGPPLREMLAEVLA
ncbi:hypothetical protein PUR71_05775 [Streptomyces sp. SP17BM10]|uniref:hypothetical protein n=1 Tax=Streptomyces sp. SP17BM10 TaxID=3002530 RepID=UPI002E76BE9F|nr:hypothetical protein [Streptomyces sp. SP17BM10]MEE1782432.1 hypothetical protein [Streptomyces sp. SP17BM10]